MIAPGSEGFPGGVASQFGVMRLVDALDIVGYARWIRFDAVISGHLHSSIADVIFVERSNVAKKAHLLAMHDRALAAFQAIEDAEGAA